MFDLFAVLLACIVQPLVIPVAAGAVFLLVGRFILETWP